MEKSCESPHSDSDLVHYIIVRDDLSLGQKLAQCTHAAGESVLETVPSNTVAVVLAAKNIEQLLEIREKLISKSIRHILISECDGEPMAIGITPTRDRKSIRKVVSSLPLVK